MQRGSAFTWETAERLTAAHMRLLGYRDAAVTGRGADGGIDVAARDAIAQVKYRTSVTGSPDIQRLIGAGTPDQLAMFYSLAEYSVPAIGVAETRGVALFVYTTTGTVRAVNRRAQIISESASGSTVIVVPGFTSEVQQAHLELVARVHAEGVSKSEVRQKVLAELCKQRDALNWVLELPGKSWKKYPDAIAQRALLDRVYNAASVRGSWVSSESMPPPLWAWIKLLKEGDVEGVDHVLSRARRYSEELHAHFRSLLPNEWQTWLDQLTAQEEPNVARSTEVVSGEWIYETQYREHLAHIKGPRRRKIAGSRRSDQ